MKNVTEIIHSIPHARGGVSMGMAANEYMATYSTRMCGVFLVNEIGPWIHKRVLHRRGTTL